MERQGASITKAAGIPTLTTRMSKPEPRADLDLHAQWRTRADGLGFADDRLLDLVGSSGRALWDVEWANVVRALGPTLSGHLPQTGNRTFASPKIPAPGIKERTAHRLLPNCSARRD